MRAVLTDIDGIFFELVDHCGEFGVSARFAHEIELFSVLGGPLTDLVHEGFVILGITNQPDIARRKISRDFLKLKHRILRRLYPQVTKVFVCEHDDSDFCECRKPRPGLLTQAAEEFGLDLSKCWVVGDSISDINAGVSQNTMTVFVRTKYNKDDSERAQADFIASSPFEAFALIARLEKEAYTLISR
jgi:D-glycero-D-manno-heptose 1,7-bisphosphate phosphatase